MLVKRSHAVAILEALGLKNVGTWDDAKILKKLSAIDQREDIDELAPEDADVAAALTGILTALEEEKELELAPDKKAKKAAAEPAAEEEAPKKKAKKAKEPEPEEDDDDAEGDDDDETVDVKPKAKAKAKKAEKAPKKEKAPPRDKGVGTRAYFCGVVLKKVGIKGPHDLNAIVAEVEKMYGKENPDSVNERETKFSLGYAIGAIKGYLAKGAAEE